MRDGWSDKDITKLKDIRRPVDERGFYAGTVQTSEIPEIIEEARPALDFYFKYKKYGNPFSGGWTGWPEWAILILDAYGSIDWSPRKD